MDISIYGISAALITYIIAEVAKKAEIPTKYIPAITILAAIAVVCVGTWSITVQGIFTAIVIGAATSGIYDNIDKGKTIVNNAFNNMVK